MKFVKKYKMHILAFLFPLLILTLFFFVNECFNNNTILNFDLKAQYIAFFEYLRDLLCGSADFPYSFSKGLGGSMYGLYFYYLADPLNFLVYFFENVPLFLNVMVLLKLSLSGLTMYIFLSSKFKENNYKLVIFSLAYALMNYNINYYINTMWLNGVVLAPLLLLSIDKILEKKSNWLYILLLFCSIYLNYYIGYILVLFSIIYFMYSFFNKYQKNWKKEYKQILNFLIVTILTGLITSFILLPCGLELLETMRVYTLEDLKIINFNFLDFVSSTYIGFGDLYDPSNYYGLCIFSGTVIIPLIICYFTNKNIPKYEKKLTAIVYIILLLPVVFPFLNLVWHMFTIPTFLNYRYSFLIVLFNLIIAYRSFQVLSVPKRALKNYFIIFIIFAISLAYTTVLTPEYYGFLNIYKIIVTVILVLVNIILIYKMRKNIILCLLVIELIINLFWIGYNSFIYKYEEYNLAKEKIGDFADKCTNNYRCESYSDYTVDNDALFSNYSGVSVFNSTSSENSYSFLLKADNYDHRQNFYSYHPDIILDMLLGVELVGAQYPINGYEVIGEDEKLYLMRNPNALSLGYLVPHDLKNFDSNLDGFFYLEKLLQAIDGNDTKYIEKLPLQKVSDTKYILEKDETYPYLYLYLDKQTKINGVEIESLLFNGTDYVAIYDQYGDKLTFEFDEVPSNFEVYTVNKDAVKAFKENRIEMKVDKNNGDYIRSYVTASEVSTLMTTIPYEKGWQVYVDGKLVEAYEILDSFLAVDLNEGYHKIEFKYHIFGLVPGIVISLLSFLILIIYQLKIKQQLISNE